MQKIKGVFCLMFTLLTVSSAYALPTTAQRLSCAKEKVAENLKQAGYALVGDSLDLKQSRTPVNALYIGVDILSLAEGRGLGSDIQYVLFKGKNGEKTVSGWMYISSFTNSIDKPMHDCTFGEPGSMSSIRLGKFILNAE